MKYLLYLTLVLIVSSCNTGSQEASQRLYKILGHRGSGANAISNFQENTLASVSNAFEMVDGAEVDIQCSKDGTIWLFHDDNLPENSKHILCVPMSSDEELVNLATLDTTFTLTKLEEVFILMKKMKNKPYLSLDVKGHFPNGCFENINAPWDYFDMLSNSLIKLLKKYRLRRYVMVETNYDYFLDSMIANYPKVNCFYLGYDNFNHCMEMVMNKKYHGISFNFRANDFCKEDIVAAHKEGIKVMLWTANDCVAIDSLLLWNPDFIQTGNLECGNEVIKRFSENSNP